MEKNSSLMPLCKCGCGYEVDSADFVRFHVEEQYENEKQSCGEFDYGHDDHDQLCGCVRCI